MITIIADSRSINDYNLLKEHKGKTEALIALWDCKSRGTEHMIEYANKNILNTYVYYMKDI